MSSEIPVQTAPLVPAADAEPSELDRDQDETQVLPVSAEVTDEPDELASDPFVDDLSAELLTAAGQRWRNRATISLGVMALLVVGFLGGVLVQKNFGSSTASTAARRTGFTGTLPGGFPRTGTGTGTGAGPGTGRPGIDQTGTIVLVDGTTIYVKLANGDTVTVKTSTDTKVSLASSAKVGSLKKGQQVTFTGSTDSSSGTVTATSVTASK